MSLHRFLDAQEADYPTALSEIRSGRKISHWMWYIFPQMAELGRSHRARFYGIADLTEARDYLAHPVLGARLVEISGAMLSHRGTAADAILGPVDALKLRSSMTVFEAAGEGPFADVLDAFYAGQRCTLTLTLLNKPCPEF